MSNSIKKTAVLSRFQETDNTFFEFLQKQDYNIIVYNKDKGDNLLPNIGRESHTYLHYIIENYDKLPDDILFSQYYPLDTVPLRHAEKRLNAPLLDFIGYGNTDYDLSVRAREIKWMEIYQKIYGWDEMTPHYIVPTGTSRYGFFRVSKKAILRHKIDFYKKCIELLSYDIDPIEGYFFERAWKYIFTNYGNCPKDFMYLRNSLWLFGDTSVPYRYPLERKKDHYGHIKLYGDGCISSTSTGLYSNDAECFWTIDDNKLYFLSNNGCITSSYDMPPMSLLISHLESNKEIIGHRYTEDNTIVENCMRLSLPMWQTSLNRIPK